MSKEQWTPNIKQPFVYLKGIEEVIPRIGGWTDLGIREWCAEIADFVPKVAKPIEFTALSPTTILQKDQDRNSTTFKMRYAKLAKPEVLKEAPSSLLNLVANYAGLVSISAYDVAKKLQGNSVLPVPLDESNQRRIEAFVTSESAGESSDWHKDEKLTLPLYVQPEQAVLVSHLTNPRNVEDLYEAPFTVIEPDYGQFLAFDGVNHPHKGVTKKYTHGDRVVLGVMYDLPGFKADGPKLDELLS